MKKHRLPLDIQFLLESILDESPDGVKLLSKDSGGSDETDPVKLNSLGAEVPKNGGEFHWMVDEAYAFFFDHKHQVIMYVRKDTHGDMEGVLKTAADKAKAYPATFKNMYKIERDEFNNISIMSYKDKEIYPESTPTVVRFIGLNQKDTDAETVREYLANNRAYFRYLDIRGIKDEAKEPAGRIWLKKHIISFWNSKENALKMFPLVEKMMASMKVDKKKFAYEFLDIRGMFAYKQLQGDESREKLSPEEMKKLMAIQHLDPKAKEKLAGSDFREKHLKKAAKGFDFPAQADAAMPALEEDLINEDPDGVYTTDDEGDEDRITSYTDEDAVAFMTFPTFSILLSGGVHWEIKKFLSAVYLKFITGNKVSHKDVENIMRDQDIENIEISSIDEMLKDLGGNGVAKKAFDSGIFGTPTGYRHKIKHSISGRFWNDRDIISFWNKKSDVLENWKEIQQMFKDHYGYGSLERYHVDFLERSVDSSIPLTPAESITKSKTQAPEEKKDDSKQLTMFAQLLSKPENLDNLSDAQMEKLAGKLHVMTPAQKNKVMKAAGMNYNKAAEIAEKMGLSVVQFHHLMQVTEEKLPSLQEIVANIRNKK